MDWNNHIKKILNNKIIRHICIIFLITILIIFSNLTVLEVSKLFETYQGGFIFDGYTPSIGSMIVVGIIVIILIRIIYSAYKPLIILETNQLTNIFIYTFIAFLISSYITYTNIEIIITIITIILLYMILVGYIILEKIINRKTKIKNLLISSFIYNIALIIFSMKLKKLKLHKTNKQITDTTYLRNSFIQNILLLVFYYITKFTVIAVILM